MRNPPGGHRIASSYDEETALTPPSLSFLNWRYRVGPVCIAFGLVVVLGAVSIYVTGEGQYAFFQSIYFSLVTASTVGYGELPHLAEHPWARGVAAVMIILGVTVLAFFQSTLTALFLDGAFSEAFRRRRMEKRIAKLEKHYTLVGCRILVSGLMGISWL